MRCTRAHSSARVYSPGANACVASVNHAGFHSPRHETRSCFAKTSALWDALPRHALAHGRALAHCVAPTGAPAYRHPPRAVGHQRRRRACGPATLALFRARRRRAVKRRVGVHRLVASQCASVPSPTGHRMPAASPASPVSSPPNTGTTPTPHSVVSSSAPVAGSTTPTPHSVVSSSAPVAGSAAYGPMRNAASNPGSASTASPAVPGRASTRPAPRLRARHESALGPWRAHCTAPRAAAQARHPRLRCVVIDGYGRSG